MGGRTTSGGSPFRVSAGTTGKAGPAGPLRGTAGTACKTKTTGPHRWSVRRGLLGLEGVELGSCESGATDTGERESSLGTSEQRQRVTWPYVKQKKVMSRPDVEQKQVTSRPPKVTVKGTSRPLDMTKKKMKWRNQLCVLAGWNRSELCVLARRDRSELCILTSCSGPCILAGRWRPALFSPACFSEPCVVTCRWRTCNAAADEVAPGKGPLEGPSIHGRKRRTGVSEGSVKTDVLALSFLHKKINNAAKEGCRIIQLELYTIVYEWLHVCVQVQYSCCC
ncbi:uncharacterized protein LOC129176994 isoform X2 [Dunckerocampus dactyliophorus]|uniref:uncharacterized protein LOC129176994 isoform X2 n=1 Tax=Dunckerocampus dactyliophorus TaxID=161453 RepID=UPI002404D3BA|nr:uncharacterized protein LOC129176994 isoform X2 [Dunckerocampus dactyliophorus]